MVSYKDYVILKEKRKTRKKHKLRTKSKGIYGMPLYWAGYPMTGPMDPGFSGSGAEGGAGEG